MANISGSLNTWENPFMVVDVSESSKDIPPEHAVCFRWNFESYENFPINTQTTPVPTHVEPYDTINDIATFLRAYSMLHSSIRLLMTLVSGIQKYICTHARASIGALQRNGNGGIVQTNGGNCKRRRVSS